MKPNIPQTLQTVMLRNGQGMKNKLQPEPKTKPESKNKTRNKKTVVSQYISFSLFTY